MQMLPELNTINNCILARYIVKILYEPGTVDKAV